MKPTKLHTIISVVETNLFVPLVSLLFMVGLGIDGSQIFTGNGAGW